MFSDISSVPPLHDQCFIHQYQTNARICSQYIALARDRLCLEEAARISQANDLLERLAPCPRGKDASQCDGYTTRDSVILEDLSLANPLDLTLNLGNVTDRSRPLTRRSTVGSRTSRDFEGGIGEALGEIERTCSPKCANLVRRLLEDFRKLKGRAVESEKKERASRQLERIIEDLQERTIMMGQRVEEAEGELERQRGENHQLRCENRELNDLLFQKMNEINSERKIRLFEEIAERSDPQDALHVVAQVVQEKETIIALRLEAVRQAEARVEEALFGCGEACGDCCARLRRLRHCVFAYKQYLEQEAAIFERMFDAFRASAAQ